MVLPLEVQQRMDELRRAPGEGDGDTVLMPLEYKSGQPPTGYPSTVILTAPPAGEDHLVARRCIEAKNESPALLACLPPKLANQEFIGLLAFNCYANLTGCAVGLVWGERLAAYMVEIGQEGNPSQFFSM